MDSWIRCRVDLYAFFFLRCFNILCYASGFYMLLFVVRCLWCERVRARVCAFYWHCSAQLSMFNMEKHYRNKIIIIIIIIMDKHHWLHGSLCCLYGQNTIIWQQQNVRYSQCPWFPASCSSIFLSSLWCTQNFPVSVWHIITQYMQLPGSCKTANIFF